MSRVSKSRLVGELSRMLEDLFTEHKRGAAGSRLARAHGYLDCYMRGLIDAGILTPAELLLVVSDERRRVDGPAAASVTPDLEAA